MPPLCALTLCYVTLCFFLKVSYVMSPCCVLTRHNFPQFIAEPTSTNLIQQNLGNCGSGKFRGEVLLIHALAQNFEYFMYF